jgi:hypothetical protein
VIDWSQAASELEEITMSRKIKTRDRRERRGKPGQQKGLEGNGAQEGAATRVAVRKPHQRGPSVLVTPEQYAYVKRDLVTIGILTSMMIAGMAVIYFFFWI